MRATLIIVALLAGAGALYWQQYSMVDTVEDARLFEDFSVEQMNGVDYFSVSRAGVRQVHLSKRDGLWWAVNYAPEQDHPADIDRIFVVLHALHEATLVEQKTSKPEYYERLGVEEPKPGATSKVLEVGFGDTRWRVIIGDNSLELSNGQYVRRVDEAESWLINRRMSLSIDPKEWLDKLIVDLPPEDLKKMVVYNPRSTDDVVLVRPEKGKPFGLEGVSETINPNRPREAGGVIDNLRFKDALLRSGVIPPEGRTIAVHYTTFDGLQLIIKSFKNLDDETIFLVDAAAEEGSAPAVAEFAAHLNERYALWSYHVPEHLHQALDIATPDLKL